MVELDKTVFYIEEQLIKVKPSRFIPNLYPVLWTSAGKIASMANAYYLSWAPYVCLGHLLWPEIMWRMCLEWVREMLNGITRYLRMLNWFEAQITTM